MKKIITVLIIFLIYINPVNASTNTAYEYILMDADTGRIQKGKNYNTKALIASITKIMTCILAIESGRLNDTV